MQARKTAAVEYTIEPADDAGHGLHQIRVVVHECTMLDLARQQQGEADALDWLEDTHGISRAMLAGISDDDDPVMDDETATIFIIAQETRSKLLSCVSEWQERKSAEDGRPGDWVPCDAPEDWVSIEGFASIAPQSFVLSWRQAAEQLNPGLWRPEDTPAEKKRGGVNVIRLTMN